MKLKHQSLVSHGSLIRMAQSAGEAWNRRDFQQCIETMERVSRLDPANTAVLLDLGRMYGLRYDYAAAERCFEKAVRVAQKENEILAAAGQRSRDFGNVALAERYFRRALELKDGSPETLFNLAEIYERLRRLPEASELIDRALQRDGAYAPALLLRAKLDRQDGRLDEAEKLLRTLISKAEPSVRVAGLYELGGIFDRQGRYDEAMAAFLEGKNILWPHASQKITELQLVHTRLLHLKANISGKMLKDWFDSGQTLQPLRRLALLGGHPRSGTTLLEQVFRLSPRHRFSGGDNHFPRRCLFSSQARITTRRSHAPGSRIGADRSIAAITR